MHVSAIFFISARLCLPLRVQNATFHDIAIVSGEAIVYSCDVGYVHTTGDLSRTCLRDGTWDGTLPVCEGKNWAKMIIG